MLPIGVIEVPLSRLQYWDIGHPDTEQRAFDPDHKEFLENKFLNTPIEDFLEDNQLSGYILERDIPIVLEDLGLSRAQLERTFFAASYPQLRHCVVYYVQGRHRVAAAENLKTTWTVRLHATATWDDLVRHMILQSQAKHQSNEKEWSDGDAFFQIRKAQDITDYTKFTCTLGPSKKRSLKDLESRPHIDAVLRDLMVFPGLRRELNLGVFYKYFVLHLDEEVYRYLSHTLEVCLKITGGRPGFLDAKTVSRVEGRWPAVSNDDRRILQQNFSQSVHSKKARHASQCFEQRVLLYPGMISSIRTFHEYMKYVDIAAHIVYDLILPEHHELPLEDMIINDADEDYIGKSTISLSRILASFWDHTSHPMVEVREGVFLQVKGPASAELAYAGLMLASLRHFPYLGKGQPRYGKGKQDEKAKVACTKLYHERAYLLGFRTPKIEQGLLTPAEKFHGSSQPTWTDESEFLKRRDRRWGRPHLNTFRKIQEVAFLPNFMSNDPLNGEINVRLIFGDFFRSFFGTFRLEMDESLPEVQLNIGHNYLDELPEVNMGHNYFATMPSTDHTVQHGVAMEPPIEDVTMGGGYREEEGQHSNLNPVLSQTQCEFNVHKIITPRPRGSSRMIGGRLEMPNLVQSVRLPEEHAKNHRNLSGGRCVDSDYIPHDTFPETRSIASSAIVHDSDPSMSPIDAMTPGERSTAPSNPESCSIPINSQVTAISRSAFSSLAFNPVFEPAGLWCRHSLARSSAPNVPSPINTVDTSSWHSVLLDDPNSVSSRESLNFFLGESSTGCRSSIWNLSEGGSSRRIFDGSQGFDDSDDEEF